MVALERIEGPVAVGDHSNAALNADEDCHRGGRVAGARGRLGCVQELGGVLQKPAHKYLFGTAWANLKENLSLAQAAIDRDYLTGDEVARV